MGVQSAEIAQVRAFNRFYTSVIGLLAEGMHESVFSLAEARVIYELGKRRIPTAASALAREAARNQIRLALQSGAPFAEPLAVLGDPPAALAENAETGVPSQSDLIAEFPDLSRAALRTARTTEAAGVGSLFRNAFNPRSLEPQQGSDPDAVLSRAEAAVREGDLETALTEIEALPAEVQAVLQDWTTRARARAAALAAADDYLQDG